MCGCKAPARLHPARSQIVALIWVDIAWDAAAALQPYSLQLFLTDNMNGIHENIYPQHPITTFIIHRGKIIKIHYISHIEITPIYRCVCICAIVILQGRVEVESVSVSTLCSGYLRDLINGNILIKPSPNPINYFL